MPNDPKPIQTSTPGRQRRVTMQDVGRLAGVSQVTVSRALSDPSRVSPGALEKIRDAIEATGFVRNAVAGTLASRRSGLISALIPAITNPVHSSMVQAFSERLRGMDYQILLSDTGFDEAAEERAVRAHLSRQPDAILLTGIRHTPAARRLLLGAGIPVVELWDATESPIDLCVGFSHTDAGRSAAEFALGKGYRRAATVTASDERARRRQAAFAARFARDMGGEVPDIDVGGPASLAAGRRALAELADAGDLHGAMIFCSSDVLAQGVMIELQVRGLEIPRDVAVFGLGDQDFARYLEPALTSVRIDRDRLGRVAAEMILDRIAGRPVESPVTDLGFEIVERGST